jgi:REP element-mobilizing transposase RayT
MGRQLKLAFAKRKRRRKKVVRPGKARVPHRRRPELRSTTPVHVTLRVRDDLPNLRGFWLAAVIGEHMRRAASSPWTRQARRRDSFRVVHFSIQPNHLHLIVEAESRVALARGIQGLKAGMARRLNLHLGRHGAVFADRYHAHQLRGPREVRNGIVYVLKNYAKHPVAHPEPGTEPHQGIDPCSSARWFAGWADGRAAESTTPPVAAARTWLLGTGWRTRGGGPIDRREAPRHE